MGTVNLGLVIIYLGVSVLGVLSSFIDLAVNLLVSGIIVRLQLSISLVVSGVGIVNRLVIALVFGISLRLLLSRSRDVLFRVS